MVNSNVSQSHEPTTNALELGTGRTEDPSVSPAAESVISVHSQTCNLAKVKAKKSSTAEEDDTDNIMECSCGNESANNHILPSQYVTLQEFFSLSGFGKFQWLHVYCFVFIFIRDGAEVILAALIKPSLECYWSLSITEGALIPITAALAYAVGSQVIGIAADKLGRRNCMTVSLILVLCFDVSSAFMNNYVLWIILRDFGAFFLGGAFSSMLTMWTEICPRSSRFLSLFYFSLFWTTGTFYAVLVAFLLDMSGNLEWRIFILLLCIPTAFGVFFTLFIYETPSYLIISGHTKKAVKLINDVIKMNQMEAAQYEIICEDMQYDRGALIKLFQLPYAKVTICFLIISFAIGYTFMGWTILISKLFKINYCTTGMFDVTIDFCRSLSDKAYFIIMIVVLGGYPGFTAAYHISKKTGPMNYTSVTYFFAFYIFIAMNWCFNDYFYFVELFTSRALLGGGYLVMWLYMPVYYHTQVRAVGVGLGICFTKLGTATAALIICYNELPYKLYSFAAFCLLVTFIAVMLSEPTIRRKLFSKTDQILQVTDPEELYKHHHVSKNTLSWHIKYEKSKAQKPQSMPYQTFKNQISRANSVETCLDFNWVDHSLTGTPTTLTSSSLSANLFSFDDFPDNMDLPLEAFMNREVYLSEYDTSVKPTFKFDRSKYPVIEENEPKEGLGPSSIEPTPETSPPAKPLPPKGKTKKPKRFYRALSQDDLESRKKITGLASGAVSADNTPDPDKSSRGVKGDSKLRRRVAAPSTNIADNPPEDVEGSERVAPDHLTIKRNGKKYIKRKKRDNNRDKEKDKDRDNDKDKSENP